MSSAGADGGAAAGAMAWRRTWVDDRPALYGDAGKGVPVLFLHGWALGHRPYRRAIQRLTALGCRVYAPALPGFGGTADLPGRSFSITGYGDWLWSFADAVGIDEPVVVVGHSFGGAVAAKAAHLRPERVRSAVLVNAVGGGRWTEGDRGRALGERPLWDWGRSFPGDLWPPSNLPRVVPGVLQELLPNAVRNPAGLWRTARLARQVDLTGELRALAAARVPVTVLWGARDGVVPRAAFEAMCTAAGSDGEVIDGSHSWLLADPDAFAAVMARVLAAGAPRSGGRRAAG